MHLMHLMHLLPHQPKMLHLLLNPKRRVLLWMQSAKILMLCSLCCLKWLRKMKLPIQMMKSPPRSLLQKILTTRSILTHKISLDMMKKMLKTWPKIDSLICLACTKAKMLQKIVLQKIWNCFKISWIWRNSHLSDMHFGQNLHWLLLLQDCFNEILCS